MWLRWLYKSSSFAVLSSTESKYFLILNCRYRYNWCQNKVQHKLKAGCTGLLCSSLYFRRTYQFLECNWDYMLLKSFICQHLLSWMASPTCLLLHGTSEWFQAMPCGCLLRSCLIIVWRAAFHMLTSRISLHGGQESNLSVYYPL